MPNSLLTGVSGLLAHQRLLEVVGHNIANVNTTGYKSQRALFADLLYETIAPSTSSNQGNRGGTNPNQIGLGVKLAATDRKFSQGGLENTGEQFDLALQGDGFFVLTDGEREFYTRAGMFSRDSDGVLVAPGGLRVKRFPGVGEPDGVNPSFQVPGDDTIRLPIGASVPGVATRTVELTGNLSALLSEPVSTIKTSKQPFLDSTGNVATAATLLNDLKYNTPQYVATDEIVISGTDTDGTLVTTDLAVGPASTIQDLIDGINSIFNGVTASFSNGNIIMTSDALGPSDFKLSIRDQSGNVGLTNFSLNALESTVEGQFSDVYTTPVTIHDGQGTPHAVDLSFTKLTPNEWRLEARMSTADGTIVDNVIETISFNDDGTLGTTATPSMTFLFDGIPSPQTVEFSFETGSGTSALTHYGTGSNVSPQQDGSAPGELVSVSVEANGLINGVISNGRVFAIAQLAIAAFRNPKGLLALGDNRFEQTLNSGEPEIGVAATGSRGTVVGGALEGSNVDIAFEFTRLIVAQRGFAANARTITVSDEVLEELTNIIR